MDKVIIDGVDVSECEHYRAEIETKMPYGEYEIQKDKCHYSGIEVIQDCKGNKGCIYKQLKRLQAENERLKSIVESNNQQVEQAELLVMDNDRLQQEVENLKDTIYYDVEKYRSTLQEIGDIANTIYNTNCNYVAESHKIIDKINEVIGAE